MDIIDIILAKKKAEGVGESLATQAQSVLDDLSTASSQIGDLMSNAQEASTKALAAAGTYDNLIATTDVSFLTEFEDLIDNEVDSYTAELRASVNDLNAALGSIETINSNLNTLDTNAVTSVEVENDNNSNRKIKNVRVRKKNLSVALEMVRNYTSTGNNEDGSMTQKAITDELNNLSTRIDNIDTSSSSPSTPSIQFNEQDAGSIVAVKEDGSLKASSISESQLIEALIKTNSYSVTNTVGIIIDYESKTVTRIQDAIQYTAGTDFNKYHMYGGRRRCNVNNNGEITAWYGDVGYAEDGSNGDVMVYQPKFYYQRMPTKTTSTVVGNIIQKETLLLSDEAQINFKLHPAFYDENGNELNYILLPAYEGCTYDVSANSINSTDASGIDFDNDILHSYAGVKPISGINNNLTLMNAEKLAQNHGDGWHITTIQALSVTQMLMIVEFGSLNIQSALENGVSNRVSDNNNNFSAQTGSTSSLGNTTGHATSSTFVVGGNTSTGTTDGNRAISYRGMENPFGNIWQFILGVQIRGNGSTYGGTFYLCDSLNYNDLIDSNHYTNTNLIVSNTSGWISNMSYNSSTYDWLFVPCTANGTSVVPVGDYIWSTTNLNDTHCLFIGGNASHEAKNGIFYYNCEESLTFRHRCLNARVIHIPTYNSTSYNNNLVSWATQIGG